MRRCAAGRRRWGDVTTGLGRGCGRDRTFVAVGSIDGGETGLTDRRDGREWDGHHVVLQRRDKTSRNEACACIFTPLRGHIFPQLLWPHLRDNIFLIFRCNAPKLPTLLLLRARRRLPWPRAFCARQRACAPPWLFRLRRSRATRRPALLLASLAFRVAVLVPPCSAVRGHAMASSASERDATRAPPPPDQLALFYSLVDKCLNAGMHVRDARDAELSAKADEKGEALFGDNSLVVASLRMGESKALASLTSTARGAEQPGLIRRSLSALLSVIAILQSRLATTTLLPGTVRKDEADYYAHVLAAILATKDEPIPPLAALQRSGSAIGYVVLIDALYRSLDCLPSRLQLLWPDAQRKIIESFVRALDLLPCPLAADACPGEHRGFQVFQALDVIPRTADLHERRFENENDLLALIENMSPRNYESVFCAAVLRRWRSDAVSSVLRARGVLQTGREKYEQNLAEFEARQREDIVKHGLRDCALTSCAKTEKTVKEFAHCFGCRSVVYCCAEHQGLHWTKHKKACREKEAARLAVEEDEKEAAAPAVAT